MKRKIFSILFALVLVVSFSLVAAAPVSAASVSEPTVVVTTKTISTASEYTITFDVTTKLLIDTDWIEVRFPYDTTVPATLTWVDADITIAYSAGIGGGAEPTAQAVGDEASTTTRTVRITLVTDGEFDQNIGSGAAVQVIFTSTTGEIINPSTVGDFTLEVRTSKDTTWKTSASYSIQALGAVHVYNAAGLWMISYSGASALDQDKAGLYYGSTNYTIEVGPGTYKITDGQNMMISADGVTLKSTDGAASTIIDGSLLTAGMPPLRIIGGDNVTVEGFTFDKSPSDSIWISGEGAIVQDNIITDTAWFGITLAEGGTAKATVSGNIITDCPGGIDLIFGCQDNTISGNVITDCAALNPRDAAQPHAAIRVSGGPTGAATSTDGNTISGNTLTDNAGCAIGLFDGLDITPGQGGTYFDDNLIKGNTISGNSLQGIKIDADLTVTNLVITDNDITDNTGVGIKIDGWTAASNAIKFNNITGNDAINGYGIDNNETDAAEGVDATHNWWGTTVSSEIAAMISDTAAGSATDYRPFLSDTVDTIFSATAVDTNVLLSLDAETEVGVVVSSTTYTPYVVSAAKYIANPGAPLDNALAFYDVYEAGGTLESTDTVTLKFYAGDDEALLWAWSSISLTWIAVSPAAQFNEFGGFLQVTLKASTALVPTVPAIEDLNGTPFAISGEEEEEPFDPLIYDVDGSGVIEIDEVLAAIVDYFAGDITIANVLEVITLYF